MLGQRYAPFDHVVECEFERCQGLAAGGRVEHGKAFALNHEFAQQAGEILLVTVCLPQVEVW